MNNYIISKCINQEKYQYLKIPSKLIGFENQNTEECEDNYGRNCFDIQGSLELSDIDRICPKCGKTMQKNGTRTRSLKYLPIGNTLTNITFPQCQLFCPNCSFTQMQEILFKAPNHNITCELEQYIIDMLSSNQYTLSQISRMTGVGKNIIKEIDKERLEIKYTTNGKELKKPEKVSNILIIDEFKLHNGYEYATHIIDGETGHILYIAHGKKKQVVYDFIEWVGEKWMAGVKAVACDMNSDFEEAFREKCPHITIVFDHFHIVKNLNDAIGNIRKDEQKRLIEEGNEEAAILLKNSKYILTSNRETLEKKDKEASEGKTISQGSDLFKLPEKKRKEGYVKKYDKLISENKLLFACDLIKEKINVAYQTTNEDTMRKEIEEIIDICIETENVHLKKFAKILFRHVDGIVSHATYNISSGKIEGINNKIKTIRRQAYGLPDDEYFFLKIMDASRNNRKNF